MHVEIEAPDDLAVVDDVPGFDRLGSHAGTSCSWLKADVEQLRGRIQNSLLHLVIGQVRAHGLRIEVVLRAPHHLHQMVVFVVSNVGRAPDRSFSSPRAAWRIRARRWVARLRSDLLNEVGDVARPSRSSCRRRCNRPRTSSRARGDLVARLHHVLQHFAGSWDRRARVQACHTRRRRSSLCASSAPGRHSASRW